jgi:hypothetical protein
MENLTRLTRPTDLLDFQHPKVEALIATRQWKSLSTFDRIGAAYNYVRDEVAFGYNISDDLPASQVLEDGIGQCNTKSTLLMALLRALNVPCRFHGFTIDKFLQHGAIAGLAYWLAPRNIIHSWVEVWHDGRWINMEGFILDRAYLNTIQKMHGNRPGPFCGYGVATNDLANPAVDWCGTDTYIQREGINHDFGLFDSPDEFYARHGVNLTGIKLWLFQRIVRLAMNNNVSSIRGRYNWV